MYFSSMYFVDIAKCSCAGGATITIHWAKMAMAAKTTCWNCLFLPARRFEIRRNGIRWNEMKKQFLACFRVALVCQRQLDFLVIFTLLARISALFSSIGHFSGPVY